MEDLIIHAHILYDHDTAPHSPPLPPTPAGEPIPPVSYGTKRTKVATIPPIHTSETLSPLLSPQDFTPRLPARPNNSIHPSSRAIPGSPTKLRAPLDKALPSTEVDVPEEDSPSSSPTAESFITTTEETKDDINSINFPTQDTSPPTPPKPVPHPPVQDSNFSLSDTPQVK
jgi:hypothetical protein